MNETIDYYNRNAEAFVAGTVNADMSDTRKRFIHLITPGGKILDAGCGSGRDSLAFIQEGFQVDAFDASKEICQIASRLLGFEVKCMRFEDIYGNEEYDGIWACASLLHVKSEDLPDVVNRLRRLLKPNGILYASFKEGKTERTKDGRYFNDMTENACLNLFHNSGFSVIDIYKSRDVREGREGEFWVNCIVKIKA